MTPEGKIKRKVSAFLKSLGENVWYFMPVKHVLYGNKSLDYICCVNSQFVSIETKKDAKTKLTALQSNTARLMEKAGGKVLIVYDDVSLEEAKIYVRSCLEAQPGTGD